MKKILIIIIIFCFYTNVRAETFYGDYFKVENIDGVDSDLIKVDSYKLYNTYKIEYEDMGYLEENDLYIKDENDYIYEDNISSEYSIYDEIIKVSTNTGGARIMYFSFLSENLKIYELEAYSNDEKIDYVFVDVDASIITKNNLNDGNYDTYYDKFYERLDVNGNANIIIYFPKKFKLEDLKFIIYTKEDSDMNFTILLENYKKINLNNNVERKHIIYFVNEEKTKDEKIEYFYLNKNKIYRYYKENIVVLDDYVLEGDNLILYDYIEKVDLYKRNKLILKEDLIVQNKYYSAYDFIEYSSDTPIINCDIDINVNGIYKCNFLLEGLSIEKEIEVNVKDEEVIEEKNEEKNSINSNISLDEENNEYIENEEVIENKKDILDDIKEFKESQVIEELENEVYIEEIKIDEVKKHENIIKTNEIKKTSNNIINKDLKKENNIVNKTNITTTKPVSKKEYKTITKEKKMKVDKRLDNKIVIRIIIVVLLIIFNIFSILKKEREIVSNLFKKLLK